MSTLISLGCNCHPAWWLRKLGLRTQSMPFDWLLSKPGAGLDYAVTMQATGFEGWLDGLSTNARGHPVAARHPQIELFHHHDLVSDDPAARTAEVDRLNARARSFLDLMKGSTSVEFLYCYPMHDKEPSTAALDSLSQSIDRALAAWPQATLHVYFMADVAGMDSGPRLAPRLRLVEHAYFRDQSIDKNWGTVPPFLAALAPPAPRGDSP